MSAPVNLLEAVRRRRIDDLEAEEARQAVFAPTPLDLLSLAELRHSAPELALALATASGRQHDREVRL